MWIDYLAHSDQIVVPPEKKVALPGRFVPLSGLKAVRPGQKAVPMVAPPGQGALRVDSGVALLTQVALRVDLGVALPGQVCDVSPYGTN